MVTNLDHKPDRKKERAKKMVCDYLQAQNIPGLDLATMVAIVEKATVNFESGSMWRMLVGAAGGFGSPEATEGLTSHGDRGSRSVAMNETNHTLPAIVHELFHTLEVDGLDHVLPHAVVEGITELLALSATGLFLRRDRSNSSVYANNVRLIRLGLDRGKITMNDLMRAYFLREISAGLKIVADAWNYFSEQDAKNNFLYTGKPADPDKTKQLWKDIAEKYFS